jgi:BioD-like phosphotransacetylase family protein
MADPNELPPNELTMDELRERIRVAGITVAEHRLAMVRRLLADALAPVRGLDSRTIRTVEPAVKFVPEAKGDSRE